MPNLWKDIVVSACVRHWEIFDVSIELLRLIRKKSHKISMFSWIMVIVRSEFWQAFHSLFWNFFLFPFVVLLTLSFTDLKLPLSFNLGDWMIVWVIFKPTWAGLFWKSQGWWGAVGSLVGKRWKNVLYLCTYIVLVIWNKPW